MKMYPSDYRALRDMVEAHLKRHKVNLRRVREDYDQAGLSETRFVFDMFYAVPGAERRDWFDRGIYDYLNDDHIRTALRRVVQELSPQVVA